MLVVETQFARTARSVPLSRIQRDLVIGSLLGDGYLMPTTAGCCFRVSHGSHQADYVEWKFGLLGSYVRTAPRRCGGSYYFRTVSHPDLSELQRLFYVGGSTKKVPLNLLERDLTAFGLAVWFMDDGASDGKQVRINSQGFSECENAALIRFLRAKFGIVARLNKDKDRVRLRMRDASMERFRELVEPHLIPTMLYKLPL